MTGIAVFGANGFLGRNLCRHLVEHDRDVVALTRSDWPSPGANLGHVIFTIGMNANFRGRPFETYDAHIDQLKRILTEYSFASLLYISSTRVYLGAGDTHESSSLLVSPLHPDQIFNISKLAGEALCISMRNPRVRIARVSNIYGAGDTSDVFLTAVMREAAATGAVTFHTAEASAKDYIHIDDVVPALLAIVERGSQAIYNVASGQNTCNRNIADLLEQAGIECRFAAGAPTISFPQIEISALKTLGARIRPVAECLPDVFSAVRSQSIK